MSRKGLGTFWRWSLLGAGSLFFGNLAMIHARVCSKLVFWEHAAEPQAYFVLSGAVTIGLVAVACSWTWQELRRRNVE